MTDDKKKSLLESKKNHQNFPTNMGDGEEKILINDDDKFLGLYETYNVR